MISRLQTEHFSCQRESEARFFMQSGQSVSKILTPGRYEHGISQSRLLDYSYLPGELIVCNRGIEEWVRWRSPIQILKINLPDQAFRAIAQEAGADSVEIASSTNYKDERVAALISAFQAEQATGFLSGRLFTDSIAQAIAAALVESRGVLRRPLRRVKCGLTPMQVAKVSEIIHSHLDRDLSLVELAAAAGLSTGYFSQMFRTATGQSPHQFVLAARIERAKSLLKGSQRVIDVALRCGFKTQQHFSRVFRTMCNISPTEYRRHEGIADVSAFEVKGQAFTIDFTGPYTNDKTGTRQETERNVRLGESLSVRI